MSRASTIQPSVINTVTLKRDALGRIIHEHNGVEELTRRYDARGNLRQRREGYRIQTYRYYADNRLIGAKGDGPEGTFEARYHYDALGRRLSKVVKIRGDVRETRFLWQGLRLIQSTTAQGEQTYCYDPDEPHTPLACIEKRHGDAQLYWYHTDLNGSPQEVTDEKGEMVWSGQYAAWGQVVCQTDAMWRNMAKPLGTFRQPLRYAGQYVDEETGLHYNTFRYYAPEAGRFTTPDPIGLAGGLNLYAYAPNPLKYIDPLGLTTCSLSGNKIKRGDGNELISIPDNARVRRLTPPEGYSGDYGYEYKWANEGGGTTTVRIHGVDPLAPPGSNASQGWVIRIMDGKKSMDINGVYHPPGVFNPASPSYNPSIINDVHIPINKPTNFPRVD